MVSSRQTPEQRSASLLTRAAQALTISIGLGSATFPANAQANEAGKDATPVFVGHAPSSPLQHASLPAFPKDIAPAPTWSKETLVQPIGLLVNNFALLAGINIWGRRRCVKAVE